MSFQSLVKLLNTRQGIANIATATTRDIEKIDEVTEFLENWTCGQSREVKIIYYRF